VRLILQDAKGQTVAELDRKGDPPEIIQRSGLYYIRMAVTSHRAYYKVAQVVILD
jgi:hypothetical protein